MHQYILKGMILSLLTNSFVNAQIANAQQKDNSLDSFADSDNLSKIIYFGLRQEILTQSYKNNENKLSNAVNTQTEISISPSLRGLRGELFMPFWASMDTGLYPKADSTTSFSGSFGLKGKFVLTPLSVIRGDFIKGMSQSNIFTKLSTKTEVATGIKDNGESYKQKFSKTISGITSKLNQNIVLFSDISLENSNIFIKSQNLELTRKEYSLLSGITYSPQEKIIVNTKIILTDSDKLVDNNKQVQGMHIYINEALDYQLSAMSNLGIQFGVIPYLKSYNTILRQNFFGSLGLSLLFTRHFDFYAAFNQEMDTATQMALLGIKSGADANFAYKITDYHKINLAGSYSTNQANDKAILINQKKTYFAKIDYTYKASPELFYTGSLESVKLTDNIKPKKSESIFIIKGFINWNTKVRE